MTHFLWYRMFMLVISLAALAGCRSRVPSVDDRPHPIDGTLRVQCADSGVDDRAFPGAEVVISGTYRLDDPNPALLRPNIFVEIIRSPGDGATMASHSAQQSEDGALVRFECRLDAPDRPGLYTVAAKHARREGVTTVASRELTVTAPTGGTQK